MSAARGVRGVVASLFVMGVAAAGFAVVASAARAGADGGIPCHVEDGGGVCAARGHEDGDRDAGAVTASGHHVLGGRGLWARA